MIQTLAHLSDLHLGRSPANDLEVARAVEALLEGGVDHVVLSGDVTERGRAHEYARYVALFAPLLQAGRLTVVPGNHDRLGDDLGARLRRGARVQTETRHGVYVVRVDSTGPHNRFLLAGHGDLDDTVLGEIERAVAAAPSGHLVVVTMHHHPLPLPEETLPELLATRIGLPYATELHLGKMLLTRLRGRCDLVLHGHRHVPQQRVLFASDARPLGLYNAGSSPSLGRFRVFAHAGGRLCGAPGWLVSRERPLRAAVAERMQLKSGTEDA